VSGDARFNNRLESGVGKTPFQPATQSVVAESPSEVNCPTTRGVSSWAILRAHLSAERLSFPITSVRFKFAVQIKAKVTQPKQNTWL
jgi:hypothetical protein